MEVNPQPKQVTTVLFHHILVAVDGSKQSNKALEKAVKLTERETAAKLTALHVLNFAPLVAGDLIFTPQDAIRNLLQEKAEKLVEETRGKISHLPYAEVSLVQGYPAKAILEVAERTNCDLIVLGSRGLGPIREFVLGSVSHNVVQNAKIPVLVVK
jgi:nucleotide-binding universal stress UspA family protein